MKKKIVWAFAALVLILGVTLGTSLFRKPAQTGDKEIHVKVIDQTQTKEQIVLEDSYYTDASTLTEFINETDALDASMEQSDYGSLLMEIAGLKQDMDKGPWLVFDSENNTVCKEAGMCPAMDDVLIEDQDEFTFSLISEFE